MAPQEPIEVFVNNLKCVKSELDSLRVDSEKILQEQGHLEVSQMLVQSITQGVGQTQDLMALVCCIQSIEMEKQNLRKQVQILRDENAFLREEWQLTQQKLQTSEVLVAQLEEEKKHFEFMASLQKADEGVVSDAPEPAAVELFSEEGREEQVVLSPQQITQMMNQNAFQAHLRTLHNLAVQYASQGRYNEAIPICNQAIQDLEKTVGHNHPEVATMLNILALIYRDQNNYRDAIKLLNEAAVIRKQTLGESHPIVAATLNNLAVLYGKSGKYREAELLCREAMEIRINSLGENHIDVAKQLNNLALLCQNQGKYEAVEICYKRALQIYELTFGPNHPSVTATIMSLRSCYLKQRKFKEANMLAPTRPYQK